MKIGARWILRVKEGHKLTQSCVEELLGDVTDLCLYTVSQLGTQVSSLLREAGIKMDDIPGLDELFQPGSSYCQPFYQLEIQHWQLTFYTSHFNYVVSSLLRLRRVKVAEQINLLPTCLPLRTSLNLCSLRFVEVSGVHMFT